MKPPRLFSCSTGYTLTEVMVVVSLIVIMSSTGYSGFSSWQKKQKVRSAAYEFAGYLKEARMKAIEKCCTYFITFEAARYTITMDADGNDTQDDNDILVRQVDLGALDSSMTVTVPNSYPLRYNSKGLPINRTGGFGAGTVTFTNGEGFTVNVVITALGSVTVNENNN